jgi:hypothetical protein
MEHRIEIALARRWYGSSWVGHGHYFANYQGERIGEWRVPECEAARWLKANRGAVDTDVLVTTRSGQPSMRGSIGWLAERTVEENDRVSPRWIKWRAFGVEPQDGVQRICSTGVKLPSDDPDATSVALAA